MLMSGWRRMGRATGAMTYRAPCVLLLTLATLVSGPASGAEPLTVPLLVEKLAQTETMVLGAKSLLITYRRDSAETITKGTGTGDMMLLEWKTGYLDNKWFSQRRFFVVDESTQTRRYEEPLINVVRGETVVEFRAGHKSAVVGLTENGRNTYRDLTYFSNYSLDAPKYVAKSLGIEAKLGEIRKEFAMYTDLPFLPEAISGNLSSYSVLPDKELIEGASCWVVERKGKDRIWVDEDSLVIRRRKHSWKSSQSTQLDVVNSDFREVKPGLLLPFKQVETTYFDPTYLPKLADQVRFVATYVVEEIKFDTLDDSFFDLTLPQGTTVYDAIRDFNYVVSNDRASAFEAPIAKAKSELKAVARPVAIRMWLLILLNVALIVGVIGLLLFRRLRRGGSQ